MSTSRLPSNPAMPPGPPDKSPEWAITQNSRNAQRFQSLDIISRIIKSFIEIKGDRFFSDDKAIVAGFGLLDDRTVCVIAHQKGRSTKEKTERNFGMPNPEGYRKARRAIRLAERFGAPILTLIDTKGAFPGIEAEKHGQSYAIAQSLITLVSVKVPVVSLILGEGGSGGALAIALSDRLFMMRQSIFSVISPEACSSIIYKDNSRAEEVARSLKASSGNNLRFKIADGIIEEPQEIDEHLFDDISTSISANLTNAFQELSQIDIISLLKSRYARYRNIDSYGMSLESP